MSEHLVDVKGLAKILAVPEGWVYRQSEAGKLPTIRCGKYLRFRLSDVLEMLEADSKGLEGA